MLPRLVNSQVAGLNRPSTASFNLLKICFFSRQSNQLFNFFAIRENKNVDNFHFFVRLSILRNLSFPHVVEWFNCFSYFDLFGRRKLDSFRRPINLDELSRQSNFETKQMNLFCFQIFGQQKDATCSEMFVIEKVVPSSRFGAISKIGKTFWSNGWC